MYPPLVIVRVATSCACFRASSTLVWPARAAEKICPTVSPSPSNSGNGDELHADVGYRLHGRMRRVGRVDRGKRHRRKRSRAGVARVVVERRAGTRRHVGPAGVLRDEVEVVRTGRPGDELLRRVDLLRAGRDGKRPCPQPVARLPRPLSGASAKPTLSETVEAFGSVTNEPATVASIHMPHLPCWNRVRFSFEAVRGGAGGTVGLHQGRRRTEWCSSTPAGRTAGATFHRTSVRRTSWTWPSGTPRSRPSRPCRGGICR